jgi:hypothetical protein
MDNDLLSQLEKWYCQQCDGDWEHQQGIKIDTLDNPGWRVTIDLNSTTLEKKNFHELKRDSSETDWFRCWIESRKFHGAGGSKNLQEILQTFISWAYSES